MTMSKTSDGFGFAMPADAEVERDMPDFLDVVEYQPPGAPARKKMAGGAYNPYESSGQLGDTARMRKPRVDLRKLSEWIKTTQQVKALREADLPPDTQATRRK